MNSTLQYRYDISGSSVAAGSSSHESLDIDRHPSVSLIAVNESLSNSATSTAHRFCNGVLRKLASFFGFHGGVPRDHESVTGCFAGGNSLTKYFEE